MKKKSGKLPNNKNKLWNNICNLWFVIHRETVKKPYKIQDTRYKKFYFMSVKINK